MNFISYTIFEYNDDNNTYKEIGCVDATSSSHARDLFVKNSGWKLKCNTRLFAKPPVCR